MLEEKQHSKLLFAYLISITTIVVLLAYTFAKFVVIPYAGFIFNPSDGSIIKVFNELDSDSGLLVGDKLVTVGKVSWSEYKASRRLSLLNEQEPGDIIEFVVTRDGEEKRIFWTYPGFSRLEALDRFSSVLWVAYVFWLAGIATMVLVQPRDTRWLLMIVFYHLTAIWISTGSLSAWHIWESAVLQRMAIWMCVPVYLHFHWLFPKPLRQVPIPIWLGMYSMAVALATLEWLEVLPRSAYYIGFFFALICSFGLLLTHSIFHPEQRGDTRLLIIGAGFAITPTLVLALSGSLDRFPWFGGLAFIALPILPGAYLYAIYNRQVGGLRVRTNRIISLYAFLVVTVILCATLIPFLFSRLDSSRETAVFVSVLVSLVIALASASLFPLFQRFFEHQVLGIPLPSTHISEVYSVRITTSLNMNRLVQLLKEEILPSLQIRQSALLQLNDQGERSFLYSAGVDTTQLSSDVDLSDLLVGAGKYRPHNSETTADVFSWIRLILTLKVEGRLIGLWLLGERDPDDSYGPAEVAVLQTIANQTAIALVNIVQSERLHSLYQSDVERNEVERANLARNLHDEILQNLAVMRISLGELATSTFEGSYLEATARIRQMISGLRPAMLDYGLGAALDELIDGLTERSLGEMIFSMDLPQSDARYPPKVEEHLYRIIQQATENAFQHAHGKTIRIGGHLMTDDVELIVSDDGVGFSGPDEVSFERLLADKHYGLAGMYERAAIIHARLDVGRVPGGGTRVLVTWNPDEGANAHDVV